MEELRAVTETLLTALKERDAETLERLLDADFNSLATSGEHLGREAYLQATTQGPYRIVELKLEMLEIEHWGDTGIVAGIQNAKLQLPNGDGANSRVAFTDVFRRRGEDWKLRLVHWTEIGPDPDAARVLEI
ncbi:MAG: nuclear transport factor 2 family protein [Acidobacteriota bacterium]